jgi:hypothetical protein
MLAAHPALFVPPESDVFQRVPLVAGGAISDPAALEKVLAVFPPYYREIYDLEWFKAEALTRLPMALPDVFALFFSTAYMGVEKPGAMWGHKMPSEWPYVATWRRWFPKAKFIHIVRHPLDSTASMVQHQLQRYPTTPLVGCWQWRKAFRSIRRQGRAMGPERYLMVKYEDLVTDPAATLNAVCSFLGVSHDHVGAMIDYMADKKTSDYTDKGVHMQETNAPITRSRIGRTDYGPEQAGKLSFLCRKEVSELGYDMRGDARPGLAARAAIRMICAGLDIAWAGLRQVRKWRGQL